MNSTAARPLEPVAAPVARALPAWVYDHPEMTRLEYERLLKPSWQIVCHVNSIPAPGDYVTLDLGADSVVARSRHSTTCAVTAARAFSRARATARARLPARTTAGPIG